MAATVYLYSKENGEVERFLNKFYNTTFNLKNSFKWEKQYENPIEIAEIIGAFIDNSDDYNLYILVCIDKNVFIQINTNNADDFIRYLYERFPY